MTKARHVIEANLRRYQPSIDSTIFSSKNKLKCEGAFGQGRPRRLRPLTLWLHFPRERASLPPRAKRRQSLSIGRGVGRQRFDRARLAESKCRITACASLPSARVSSQCALRENEYISGTPSIVSGKSSPSSMPAHFLHREKVGRRRSDGDGEGGGPNPKTLLLATRPPKQNSA